MKNVNLDPQFIREVTFHQIKLLTQASLAESSRLRSFDRQFSGVAEARA